MGQRNKELERLYLKRLELKAELEKTEDEQTKQSIEKEYKKTKIKFYKELWKTK